MGFNNQTKYVKKKQYNSHIVSLSSTYVATWNWFKIIHFFNNHFDELCWCRSLIILWLYFKLIFGRFLCLHFTLIPLLFRTALSLGCWGLQLHPPRAHGRQGGAEIQIWLKALQNVSFGSIAHFRNSFDIYSYVFFFIWLIGTTLGVSLVKPIWLKFICFHILKWLWNCWL